MTIETLIQKFNHLATVDEGLNPHEDHAERLNRLLSFGHKMKAQGATFDEALGVTHAVTYATNDEWQALVAHYNLK